MDIYLLRHGKAEEFHIGTSDSKRKLTESGRAELDEIASGITTIGIKPDLIVSSPLVRSKETAEIVSKRISLHRTLPKIRIWADLKPESDIYQTHKSLMRMAPDARIMLVGHEPHLSSLAYSMISAPESHLRRNHTLNQNNNFYHNTFNLKKGGLVMIRANATNSMMCGTLRYMLNPKQLKLLSRIK